MIAKTRIAARPRGVAMTSYQDRKWDIQFHKGDLARIKSENNAREARIKELEGRLDDLIKAVQKAVDEALVWRGTNR